MIERIIEFATATPLRRVLGVLAVLLVLWVLLPWFLGGGIEGISPAGAPF